MPPRDDSPIRRAFTTRPAVWLGLLLAVCLGCSCTSSGSDDSFSKRKKASDWYQLDQFAELHLSVGQLKTSRLKDGTLIGQFEVTNKTDQPVKFKYKWLWLDSNDLSIDHRPNIRWKPISLDAREQRIIESRTTSTTALKPMIRIREQNSSGLAGSTH